MAGSSSPTGLMNIGMWEGSKEDVKQDKRLAKKRGMTMKQWEASEADVKHDTGKSAKGLRGGGLATRGKGIALKKGGSIKEKGTGEVYSSKGAMKRHEKKESPMMEKSEYKGGGIAVKGKGVALKGGGMATRGMGAAYKKGGMAKRKGC